ncbi:hypothetical protein GA0115253_104521, partial [Streptomyces sp. Termitarium-T10T-6]
ARDTVETAVHLERTLDTDLTRALSGRVPAAVHGTAHDVLVTATVLAFARWRQERGDRVGDDVIAVESDGREEGVVPGAELASTIGRFTSWYPVAPDLPGSPGAQGAEARRALMAVKEHLRETPDRGIGHGLLHHLDDPVGPSVPPRSSSRTVAPPLPSRTRAGCSPANRCRHRPPRCSSRWRSPPPRPRAPTDPG